MLLVAGGQLDPNVGRLLRRVLARRIPFKDVLVGPALRPSLCYALDGDLEIDGVPLAVRSCFLRHDVFLAQKTGSEADQRAALNWFQAIKGWALSRPDVRLLNRHIRRADQGKVETLARARECGLAIPPTVVANRAVLATSSEGIRKPVAGGELTETVGPDDRLDYPYILQPRLPGPELRLFRVGSQLIALRIDSPDLDYRRHHNARIVGHDVPLELGPPFLSLCDSYGLDFAAGDFMQAADGAWTFLEVNSQPMFAAFDRVVGGRLCDAIIDWLIEEPVD